MMRSSSCDRSDFSCIDHLGLVSSNDETMLEVTKLGCVRGYRRLFNDLNFSLGPGALVQVTGPNGSGKTSLLRMICGLSPPAEGEIRWQGANIRSLGEEYFLSITYIGHRNGVKDELTAMENLRVSSGLGGVEVSRAKAAEVLDKMGFAGRETLPARLLSEGQRRRVALTRLLVCTTALWLLDEVLTSLDTAAVTLVKRVIEEHLSNGGMAIIATHQELNLSSGKFQRLELAS
jgi:heme exporter protein A